MHIGSSSKMPSTSEDAPPAVGSTLVHTNATLSMVDFLFSGVLVRFPDLKLAYSEGQIGWIPYILERADKVWEENRGWGGVADIVPEKPSMYFHRQIYGCFFDDAHGLRSVDEIGADNITYESDYPHSDSTWPHTKEIAERQMAHLDDETKLQDRPGQRHQALRARPPGPLGRPAGADGGARAWISATPRPRRNSGPSCGPGWPRCSRRCGPKPSAPRLAGRRAYDTAWQRMLFDAGYAGIDWPVEGGGRGASPVEQLIYLEELERAHAPYVGVNFVGLLHAGPTSSWRGRPSSGPGSCRPSSGATRSGARASPSPAPGATWPRCARGPSATATSTSSPGQKIWTSHAEVADYCELLVRTGAEDSRHRGITWLAMPMDRPGIDFRPLRDHRRVDRVRRALPRRGPGPGGQPDGRGERRLAGDHGHPQLRAGHGLRGRGPPVDGVPPGTPQPGPADRGLGRGRRAPPDGPSRRRARRPVGPGPAQRLPGGPDRGARDRGLRLQAGLSELRQRIGEFGMDLIGGAGLVLGRARRASTGPARSGTPSW